MTDWRARYWGPVALLLSSAASMALEIVAGRALAPYVGMSLYTWTTIIAVVLAGLALGHWIGGRAADRTAAPERLSALILLAAAGMSAVSLPLLRLAAPLADGADPLTRIGVLAMAAFFAPSLAAGTLSPILTKMALDAAPLARRGAVLGAMFALGAGGAILGTLAAGLVMIAWIGTSGSVLVVTGVYALLAPPLLGARAAVALLAVLAAGAGALGAWGLPRAFASPCLSESAYYCIRVDDTEMFGRPARVMALDHLAHGVNDREEPRLLLSPYLALVDEAVRARWPGPALDAFFIGGGAYTLPRAWAAQYPQARLMVAEIDPEVTRIARARLWFAPDARTRIVHLDGRRALGALAPDRRFDVIFGDAFHDISVPAHLVSDEFHAEIARRLTPNGIYAINAIDRLREPRFALSLALTLRQRFASVEMWLDAAELRPDEGRATWIILASPLPTSLPTGGAERRSTRGAPRTWVQVPLDALLASMPDGAIRVLTDDFAPVDRLLAPMLLDRALAE
jgi:MFS family permease